MKLRVRKEATQELYWLDEKFLFLWTPIACALTKEAIEDIAKRYSKNKYDYYREWTI